MEPLVYIIVLHWRGIEYTRNCLLSTFALDYENKKVLLVDNGSDPSLEEGLILQQEFPLLLLQRNSDNLGFAGGMNSGIQIALTNNADFVWLVNNDATLKIDTLSQLITVAKNDTTIGALAGAIVHNKADLETCSEYFGVGKILYSIGKTKMFSTKELQPVKCDWLNGANLLLKVSVLRRVGLLQEDYFLYMEDVEICERIRLNGNSCVFVPSALIYHEESASTPGDMIIWRYFYYARNRLYFFAKYTHGVQKLFSLSQILLHVLRRALTFTFTNSRGKLVARGEILATRDFFLGRKGRVSYFDAINHDG